MTDDETEVVGTFADELITHPYFLKIVDEFQRSAAQQILDTIPPAGSEREEIYYTYNGAKAFLTFMRNIVASKDKIVKTRAIQLLDAEGLDLDEDAQVEEEELTYSDGYR